VKQVNAVLRSKRNAKHKDKKRKAEESEVLKQVREALKCSKARHGLTKD
jgi:large-conductance mechanosensitive channel